MKRISKFSVATIVVLLAVGLAACGSGSGSAAGTGTQGPHESSEAQVPPAGSPTSFTHKHAKDSGGGSAQFLVKGGDNHIQEFGEEAGAAERARAAAVLHNFLHARAAFDWSTACSFLAGGTKEALESQSGGSKGCPAILKSLSGATSAIRVEALSADVGSLRVKGDRAFIIYSDVPPTVDAIAMTKEDGGWKIAGTLPTRLSY